MFPRLVSWYRQLSKAKRLAWGGALLLLSLVAAYFNTIPELQEQLETATGERDTTEVKLHTARSQAEKLPAMEQIVSDLEARIILGQKSLPASVSIDQILTETTLVAQNTGVNLHKFSPGEALLSATPFQYFKIPITIELSGSYTHLAIFFDRLVHLNLLFHVQNISLSNEGGEKEADKIVKKKKFSAVKNQEQLKASAEIIAFRAASKEELAEISSHQNPENISQPTATLSPPANSSAAAALPAAGIPGGVR